MAPSPINEPQNLEEQILSLKSQIAVYDKAAQQREQIVRNLQAFVKNIFILLDCQSDDLDDGIHELRKLIEKTHKLTSIIIEIHETNSSIPFSIYAKYL